MAGDGEAGDGGASPRPPALPSRMAGTCDPQCPLSDGQFGGKSAIIPAFSETGVRFCAGAGGHVLSCGYARPPGLAPRVRFSHATV